MLNDVLYEINNFYKTKTSYTKDVTFTLNTLTSVFTDTFIVGEYFMIQGSRLNDGVYLVQAIDGTTITIDSTIDLTIDAEPEIEVTLTRLDIPKRLIGIIADIKVFDAGATTGITSESQGNRSISYEDGQGWTIAFASKLSKYKSIRWC